MSAARPHLPGTPRDDWLGLLGIALDRINRALSIIGMVALLVASLVLTYSVFSRP